ncbi:MAG: arsenite efflux transporter metallochaperone ArsD [Deltaproteobacteria bacterium]|nr:arsenite efflux transporter metallochaperone ArsD [Deltaproteobacteria bacterium]
MTAVRVFDPAMCCSTGVCGPSVDPQLARFAADLDWLKGRGVGVERFNLAQQPAAFAGHAAVKAALEAKGEAALPLVEVDGTVKCSGVYPSRDELAAWAGLGAPAAGLYTEAVEELVAIGAAVASNCEPCFKFHYDKARKLGVSNDDMFRAVMTAQSVKEAPAAAMLQLADRYLRRQAAPLAVAPAESASAACCGPADPAKGGCC